MVHTEVHEEGTVIEFCRPVRPGSEAMNMYHLRTFPRIMGDCVQTVHTVNEGCQREE